MADIIEIFENTVKKFGERVAIADSECEYTFFQVMDCAKRASALVKQSAPVGVFAYREAHTLPLFFAALYSGNCYLPLDPELPPEKLEKILKSAGVKTVLSTKDERKEDVCYAGAELVTVDFKALPAVEITRKKCDLLYIIYTSGSTGVPKGVAKSHSAMADFVCAYNDTFGFDENTIIGNQTPFYFDASAKDIYLTVAFGCKMEILPTSLFTFPVRLVEYMNERRVNFISWVPSALSIVTRMNTFMEVKPEYLERVFFVGEVFPLRQLRKWREALPGVQFVNLYGSSEICGISCYKEVTQDPDDNDGIPLGKPLCNCEVRLVEEGRVITERGVPAEIYVSSKALADGYYNDSARTEESFVEMDGKRFYRTGDIARYDENGDLIFASRRDFQIKHMGHRIELGEIETVALTVEGIVLCCCLYDKKHSRIILYCETDGSLSDRDVLEALKPRLVSYMLPHRVVISDELPKNQNGKIDRAALNMTLNKGV